MKFNFRMIFVLRAIKKILDLYINQPFLWAFPFKSLFRSETRFSNSELLLSLRFCRSYIHQHLYVKVTAKMNLSWWNSEHHFFSSFCEIKFFSGWKPTADQNKIINIFLVVKIISTFLRTNIKAAFSLEHFLSLSVSCRTYKMEEIYRFHSSRLRWFLSHTLSL